MDVGPKKKCFSECPTWVKVKKKVNKRTPQNMNKRTASLILTPTISADELFFSSITRSITTAVASKPSGSSVPRLLSGTYGGGGRGIGSPTYKILKKVQKSGSSADFGLGPW